MAKAGTREALGGGALRSSLAAPAIHRAREFAFALRAWLADHRPDKQGRIRELSGDLPVPPSALRSRVIRNAGALTFLSSGERHWRFIRRAYARAGANPNQIGRLLDFGCGCGRVLRWWPADAVAELHGTDLNPKLAAWCDEHLPGVAAADNGPLPPTRYESDYFDAIYSISIFTHLPQQQQGPWMSELARLLRPGGVLLFSVSGAAYEAGLPPADRERYAAGELVVHFDDSPGSNLCAACHPPAYVTGELLPPAGLELVEHIPGDPTVYMRQDAYVVRKPPS